VYLKSPLWQCLRNIIGTASALDAMCSEGGPLPADAADLVLADVRRIEKELGYLVDDLAYVLPSRRGQKGAPCKPRP
jgi:hypothetical protein